MENSKQSWVPSKLFNKMNVH